MDPKSSKAIRGMFPPMAGNPVKPGSHWWACMVADVAHCVEAGCSREWIEVVIKDMYGVPDVFAMIEAGEKWLAEQRPEEVEA